LLYLTGTPIGNMGDISQRAIEVISEADVVLCEDTRVTGQLLSNLSIPGKKLVSYHEHNKASRADYVLGLLKEGLNVVQVSDAGMPGISDPGADLVTLCIENNLEFTVIPGPCACITALVMSGMLTNHYYYEGFLPSSGSQRTARIKALTKISDTIVLYEAPHRIKKLIDELISWGFGESKIALCRELTKRYEEVIRLTVNEAKNYFEENEPRGEFVVCLEPLKDEGRSLSEDEINSEILRLNAEGMSVKDITAVLVKLTGQSKSDMYRKVLNLVKS